MNGMRINLLDRTIDFSKDVEKLQKQDDILPESSFSKMLENSMKTVNDLQISSDSLTQRLTLGEVDDVSQVTLAVSEAENALRLMTEVRNKLVDAYQQIARMPV